MCENNAWTWWQHIDNVEVGEKAKMRRMTPQSYNDWERVEGVVCSRKGKCRLGPRRAILDAGWVENPGTCKNPKG